MRESEVYQKVKQRLPHFSIDRIENTIVAGTPDAVLTHVTGMMWAELKVQSHFNVLHDVRASQQTWMWHKLKKGLGHKFCIISGHERKQTLDIWRVLLADKGDTAAVAGMRVEEWCSFKLGGYGKHDVSFEVSLLQLMHLRGIRPEV